MGKMNELSAVIDELINCGNGLLHAAEALKEFYSSDEPEPKKVSKTKKTTTEDTSSKAEETTESKALTKEEVRKILSAKSTADNGAFKVEVRNLVKKYADGGSLGDVNPSDYAALVDEVEAIGNE